MSLLADTCWVEPSRHAAVSNEVIYQFYVVKYHIKKCHLKRYFIVLVTFQKYNRTLLTYVFSPKNRQPWKKVLLYYKIWAHQHKMPLGFAQLLPKLHPKWQGYLDFTFFIQSGFNCDSVNYDMSLISKRLAPICRTIAQLANYSWAKNVDQNTARLPCWLARGQQVSHQSWIWGIHC